MIDFKQTFRIRRALCRALQQSQKLESQIAEQSAKIEINCKREMLFLLSAWLLELKSLTVLTEAERSEIQSLTQMSLEKWVQLQAISLQIEKDLKEAESKEIEAAAMLKKKAPSPMTKWVADSDSKAHITALQKNLEVSRKHREGLSVALKQNIKKRQILGETFFRDCLNQWDELASTQALGKQAAAIQNRMISQNNTIWVKHLNQQTEDLDQIANLLDSLRGCYRNVPTVSPSQYQPPSVQAQENTQGSQENQ